MRIYVVCFLPRSGSNLFCDGLSASQWSGEPDEWFGPSRLHRRLYEWGLADPLSSRENPKPICWESYVKALIEKTSSNDTFGVKVHWYHLALVSQAYKNGNFIDLRSSRLRGEITCGSFRHYSEIFSG